MQRFLVVLNLEVIKLALLRWRNKVASVFSRENESATENESLSLHGDDTEERFAAWEAARGEILDQAEGYEQEGVRLLARAALLRTSVKCDDRGESFIASELREHADDVSLRDASSARPQLRLVGNEFSPANRGA
jgi:hypothetical protein